MGPIRYFPPRVLGFLLLAVTLAAGTAHAQPTLLHPADPPPSGGFGFSVAADGATFVAGAPGIQGSTEHGVFVYERIGSEWTETAALRDADGNVGDSKFGASVSIDGGRIGVGAEFNPGGGAAFLFVRSGAEWLQEATLLPFDGPAGDFGYHVVVRGDLAVVGAPDISQFGGNEAAFVFRRTAEGWVEEARLRNADGLSGDEFGTSVAIAGPDEVWVSAPLNQNATGFGAVYRFERAGDAWTQVEKLVRPAPGTGGRFGHSISVGAAYAAVGAPALLPGFSPEAVWTYRRQGVGWEPDGLLQTDTPQVAVGLGWWVDVREDRLAVGAQFYGFEPSPEQEGSTLPESRGRFAKRHAAARTGQALGAGLLYVRDADGWRLRQESLNPDPEGSFATFGWSVALADDDLLVGDPASLQAGPNAGAVYAFPITVSSANELGGPVGGELHVVGPHPNPASGSARVRVELGGPQAVHVALFDALGRRVARVHDGALAAGPRDLTLDLRGLPPGVYLVRVQGTHETVVRHLTVVGR